MITEQQQTHYHTFGFLLTPGLLSQQEMHEVTQLADEIWAENEEQEKNEERRYPGFIERRKGLHSLVSDERIYRSVEILLGADLIWVGSEGNISNRREVNWHPDRKYYRNGEEERINFGQIKIMIYLDEVRRDSGCLRVIPGSHRMPMHRNLKKLEVEPGNRPFGIHGADIPCVALETNPGDIIFFNHCLWHAAYGGGEGRRYIALKFAVRPREEDELKSLEQYTEGSFKPHEEFLNSEDPSLRSLVEERALFSTGRLG